MLPKYEVLRIEMKCLINCESREGLLHLTFISLEFSEPRLELATEVAWIAQPYLQKAHISGMLNSTFYKYGHAQSIKQKSPLV